MRNIIELSNPRKSRIGKAYRFYTLYNDTKAGQGTQVSEIFKIYSSPAATLSS